MTSEYPHGIMLATNAVLNLRSWDFNVYSDLCCVRDVSAILTALLEALDPMEEGVAGGVAEEMDEEEDEYEGVVMPPPLVRSCDLECAPHRALQTSGGYFTAV